jgi:hypothetical protein
LAGSLAAPSRGPLETCSPSRRPKLESDSDAPDDSTTDATSNELLLNLPTLDDLGVEFLADLKTRASVAAFFKAADCAEGVDVDKVWNEPLKATKRSLRAICVNYVRYEIWRLVDNNVSLKTVRPAHSPVTSPS